MGTLFVDKLDPQSGTSLEIGSNGDTITIPSGCTITNNGTATNFGITTANTPAFSVRKSSNQTLSHNSSTLITFDTEMVDSDNAFSSNTFTVPSGKGGRYMVGCMLKPNANAEISECLNMLYVNSSSGTTNKSIYTQFNKNNKTTYTIPTDRDWETTVYI